MTSILFTGLENRIKPLGFGDFANYMLACKCKAKELNCDEIWSVFPHLSGEFKDEKNRTFQNVNQLDIKYIRADDLEKERNKFDIVYELYTNKKQIVSVYSALNEAYIKFGKYETFKNERKDIKDKYILFHNRFNPQNKGRNTDQNDLLYLISNIKNLLGDKYQYWRIGEPSEYDHLFDKIVPYLYDDIDSFIDIVRNCSFVIGSSSGVFPYAQIFNNVPFIAFSCEYPDPYFHYNICSKISLDYGVRFLEFMGDKFYGKYMKQSPPTINQLKEMFEKEGL